MLPWNRWKICILMCVFCGALFFASALTVSERVDFPGTFDESLHVSYVKEMHDQPRLFVSPGELKMLDKETHLKWTEEINILPHSTFYYNLMAAFVSDWEIPKTVYQLRLINMIISTLAVIIAVIAFRLLFADDRAFVIAALIVALAPKAAVMAGSVNNDNLTFLSGAITLAGVAAFSRRPGALLAALCLGGGTAIGFLAKLPSGMMMAIMSALYLAFYYYRNPQQILKSTGFFALMAGLLALSMAPYLYNLITLGKVFHFWDDWHAEEARKWGTMTLSFSEFLIFFFKTVAIRWSWNNSFVFLHTIAPGLLLGLLLWGSFRQSLMKKVHGRDHAALMIASLAAFVIVASIHFYFSYQIYLRTEFIASGMFRYYLALVPALIAAAVFGLTAIGNQATQNFLTGLLLAFTLFGSLIPMALAFWLGHPAYQ